MFEGKDIVDLAMSREGQKYVLGARVHLANPDWSGPWDCAEFISWCCFHAYKIVLAVRPPDVRTGESFSGWWYEDAVRLGPIQPKAAIGTPGAILIRKPGDFGVKIGHVAISRGDNTTIEAHSSKLGVAVVKGANTRKWSAGLLIPGIQYDPPADAPRPSPPKNLLELRSPFMRGPKVQALQQALLKAGVNPGVADGVFGPATAAAVAAFQAQEGILVDGMAGPQTLALLGL